MTLLSFVRAHAPEITATTSAGITAAATVPTTDVWGQVLAGGGAASIVAALFVFVVKHYGAAQEKSQTTFANAMAEASKHFAASIEAQGQRHEQMLDKVVAHGRERERELIAALQANRKEH